MFSINRKNVDFSELVNTVLEGLRLFYNNIRNNSTFRTDLPRPVHFRNRIFTQDISLKL
jgi:hypothetical protein